MDAHEKLGNLLSEYLSSPGPVKVPSEVLEAFHRLGLTEFASRENIDETYRKKCAEIEKDMLNSPASKFAADYAAQQKAEVDAAYERIVSWLNKKA